MMQPSKKRLLVFFVLLIILSYCTGCSLTYALLPKTTSTHERISTSVVLKSTSTATTKISKKEDFVTTSTAVLVSQDVVTRPTASNYPTTTERSTKSLTMTTASRELDVLPGDYCDVRTEQGIVSKGKIQTSKETGSHYVILPFFDVMQAFGATVKWSNDTRATIYFNDKRYIADTENIFFSEEGKGNAFQSPPGSEVCYVYGSSKEILIDSYTLQSCFNILNIPIRIGEVDVENKTVNIRLRDLVEESVTVESP